MNTNISYFPSLTKLLFATVAFLFFTSGPSQAHFQSPLPNPVPNIMDLETFVNGVPLHLTGGLLVQEIGDGAYVVTEGVYQALFLVSNTGVILVDAPPSLGTPQAPTPSGETLVGAIAGVTSQPVRTLIYSHHHLDHIGGAGAILAAFPNVRIIAQRNTTDQIRRAHQFNANDPRPVPSRSITTRTRVRVGSQVIQLSHFGPGHSHGDLFIYAPQQKILMVVDIVPPGWAPLGLSEITDDVLGFLEAHDHMLAFDFDVFLGGHLTRLGTRADIERAKEYVLAVRDAAAVSISQVVIGDISDQTNVTNQDEAFLFLQSPFALIDEALADGVALCVQSILQSGEFTDLAALDVILPRNCASMVLALASDFVPTP